MLNIIKGDLFASERQTLVNTVNCVGAMGAGVALVFKNRYPEMYQQYQKLCQKHLLQPGKLWIYKAEDKWVLNFPTKVHWRNPSKEEYLHEGLQKFMDTYHERGITSIAFPLLGASNGKIAPKRSLFIMKSYLSSCDIPVDIYYNEPDGE